MDTKVDLKAEEQNLRELSVKLLEAEKRKDLDTAMTFYTEDTVAQLSEGPQTKGPEAIRTFLEHVLFKAPIKDAHLLPTRIVVSYGADMAYDIGKCRVLYEGPERRFEEMATYLRIWQKVDGQWKIVVDYWSNEGAQQ